MSRDVLGDSDVTQLSTEQRPGLIRSDATPQNLYEGAYLSSYASHV